MKSCPDLYLVKFLDVQQNRFFFLRLDDDTFNEIAFINIIVTVHDIN